MLSLGLAVAFFGMLMFTLGDFLSKHMSSRIGNKRSALAILSANVIPLLLGGYAIGFGDVDATGAAFAVAGGIANAVAYLLFFKSLETEQVSNTLSLAGVEYLLITLLSILLLGEAVNGVVVLAFAGIFIGAFLATTGKRFEFNSGYIPAIGGMVFFGITWILMAFAEKASPGIFTLLLINSFTAILILFAYLKAYPERSSRFRIGKDAFYRLAIVGLAMGIAAGLGRTSLILMAKLNFLAIGSAIYAIEPAVIIFLGYLIYKDRFQGHQIVGFAMLILAAVALSLA
ncbi:MAG: EamA family transporter [Candidatus Micrarchaeota archaeon]|nr:EamA family transporter [Candidatus Micrarchaeota archaeon]